MEGVKLSFEFIPSCCFQWRLQQALHALIDLIKWTFSPLAVLMHKPAVCRQTLSYLTRSTRVFAYLYFTERSTFQVPHRASQPTLRRSLWGLDSLTISRHSCGCSERHRRSSKHYDSHLFRVCPQWRIVPHTMIGRYTHLSLSQYLQQPCCFSQILLCFILMKSNYFYLPLFTPNLEYLITHTLLTLMWSSVTHVSSCASHPPAMNFTNKE